MRQTAEESNGCSAKPDAETKAGAGVIVACGGHVAMRGAYNAVVKC